MKFLIIDNNIDPSYWGTADFRAYARFAPHATFHVRRGPHDDLPSGPAGYDRVIVSGSKTSCLDDAPWISRLHEFIRRTLDQGKPLLGVCYGHQSLVRALADRSHVRKAAEGEFGWTQIEVFEENALLKGLPRKFHTFSSHYEEVAQLPPGFRNLARSTACDIQACQLENRPVYGIQFHPEKDLASCERSFAGYRKPGGPKKLLHPGRSSELYDAKVGESIFRNFFNL